jgi:hypothetical protein
MTSAVLYGCLAPLMAVAISWFVVKRAYLAQPAGLMPVLVAGMVIKLMFFATYTTVMLRVLHLPPVPFVASFVSSFIVLHNVEAYCMKRLFTSAC